MAAYAAVTSLKLMIDDLQHHPPPHISLNKQQFQSLTEKVNFLQEFLEGYISPYGFSDEADPLEIRIADAAYAAEDVIESYIVDNIHLSAEPAHDDIDLQKVIEEMDLIAKGAAGKMVMAAVKPQLQRKVPSDDERKSEMVGFDDVRIQLLDKLTGGDTKRQIIPIVGMGGIGKTFLAQNVFADKLIKEHFDICMWATISQDYNIEQTLKEVLSESPERGHSSGAKSVGELGEELHKYLFGRRYLVVLDDMWSIEVWDKMGFLFPECRNRSRVVVTTRDSNLFAHLSRSDNSLCMSFLNEVDSWTLFSNTVFGEGSVPDIKRELREVGEKIVGKCRGLPLSIVVIGGLLAKSERTLGHWEYVEGNLSSIVNLEDNEYCLRVLKLSYNHLPAYLKPCFLYMGVFDEDREINVSKLIKLWISEGFLKTRNNRSLRTIAKDCLKELVDRNLIFVYKLGSLGNMKYCKIHDLLRDLSLKEAEKQKFYYVLRQPSPHFIGSQRRIVIPGNTSVEKVRDALESMPLARSYVCHNHRFRRLPDSRLLRSLHAYDPSPIEGKTYSLEQVFQLVNSRHLILGVFEQNCKIPSSMNMLWNLHTLIVYSWRDLTAPVEIWRIRQLEHVEFTSRNVYLPDPPVSRDDDDMVVMENLHTLKGVMDLNLNEDMVKRVPNIKKLEIRCWKYLTGRVDCLSYVGCLSKLENFFCLVRHICCDYTQKISFPESLKKLTLFGEIGSELTDLVLDDVLQKVGRLPLLQKLVLQSGAFRTRKWETVDRQFPRLKFLKLHLCSGLETWTMSESFPLLQELNLVSLSGLKEIPAEIGDISTLRSVSLISCCKSVAESAKKILEEQEELYGDQVDLHVQVECRDSNEAQELQDLIEWQDVLQKVGRLPFVEELLLEGGFFGGGEWETIEGQYPMLKTLQLMYCRDMKKWTVSEASHFPLLQKLLLYRLSELEEIREIVTLRSIDVRF